MRTFIICWNSLLCVLNIIILFALSINNMCWDEKTSWVTLTIGTCFNIFNIIYFKHPTVTIISLLWQWVLLMQLFEAMAWRSQNSPVENKKAAHGALIANITQPIILGLLIISFTDVPTTNKLMAMILIFIYICWLMYSLNINEFNELKPAEGCGHLDLVWWKSFPGGAIPYLIVLGSVIFLLARPLQVAWFQALFIYLTLGISSTFYNCGVGSMWCWFAAAAPLATSVYFLNYPL